MGGAERQGKVVKEHARFAPKVVRPQREEWRARLHVGVGNDRKGVVKDKVARGRVEVTGEAHEGGVEVETSAVKQCHI